MNSRHPGRYHANNLPDADSRRQRACRPAVIVKVVEKVVIIIVIIVIIVVIIVEFAVLMGSALSSVPQVLLQSTV